MEKIACSRCCILESKKDDHETYCILSASSFVTQTSQVSNAQENEASSV
jgi:hypothetical protein